MMEKLTNDEMKHLRELLVKYEFGIMQTQPTPEKKELVQMARELQNDLEQKIIRLSRTK